MVFLGERQPAGTVIQEYDPTMSFSQNCDADELIMSHFVRCAIIEFEPFILSMIECARAWVCACTCACM